MISTLLVIFIILLLIKMPVSFSVIIAATVALLTRSSLNVIVIVQRMFVATESFSMIAIPFFILAGGFMEGGGISKRIVNFASVLVGHIKGGISMTSVLASMIFAGISGSAAADTAAIGTILIPAMERKGYGKDIATSVVATGGAIGIIIPPSIPMVLLGVAANISIGGMFLGGFIPGILVGLSLMFVSWIYAKKRDLPKEARASLKQILSAAKEAFWAILTIVIIIGGTVFGIFTPSEAAIVTACYTFIIGFFVYRELKVQDIPKIVWKAAITSGTVVLCVATASAFGWVMSAERVPAMIGKAIISVSSNKFVIMFLINLVLLLLGMIMEVAPIILVVAPIMYPIAMSVGITPVHFGIMTIVNMAIGQCTPPVGVCLFVASGISKVKLGSLLKTYYTYIGAMLFVLLLVTYIPALSTTLPSLVMGIK